jgi:RimJ/RimL family protein N-acetyltransferase
VRGGARGEVDQRADLRLAVAMLTAKRIQLGPVEESDLSTLFRWINDRNLVLSSARYRPVHFSDHLAWWRAVSADQSTVLFAIRLREDARLVGTCQLHWIDVASGSAELQIRIGEPDARGRGLGVEAVDLLLVHAFADLGLHRVALHVLASNAPALALYERSGFVHEGRLRDAAYRDGRREDVLLMGILREEWEQRRP